MAKSELPTIDSSEAEVTYAVASVAPERRESLAQEGIVPGAEVVVEKRLAFGGPVIVRVGRARLAIARRVARDVAIIRADR